MMMFRALLTVLSLASVPSAYAAQVSQVELSGAVASQSVQMMDQRFEPIFEEQPYQATCSREVLDHMQTVCSTTSDTVCHGTEGEVCVTQADQVCNSSGCVSVPRRVCHQEHRVCEVIPRRVCSDHAVMRTEFFSCTKYHTVQVGQRLVKTFQNNVEVMVDHPELLQGQRLVISLLGREASVSATLVSSFALNLLTIESQVVSNLDNGMNQMLAPRIMIHVDVSTAIIGKILGGSVQDLALHSSGVTMRLAGVAELSRSLMIGVKLTQHRAIINDKVIANCSLDSSGVSMSAEGGDLLVSLPLDKMGAEKLKSKRHNLIVSVSLKRPALSVLNANDLSAVLNKRLEASILNVTPN